VEDVRACGILVNARQKIGGHPPAHSSVGGGKFKYNKEKTTGGPKQEQQTVEISKYKTVWRYPIQSPTRPKQAQQAMGTASDNKPYIQLSMHV
jgi:hypothetical protein